ncbi:MAG: DUF4280 domain-containing protein [Oscillospiraceae bacterium]|nr:DUF4280 domain-containing protein [Oscillospiraceae bacterium]
MSFCLCTGAALSCSFGAAPAPFSALPVPRVVINGRPAGVMTDMAPAANIPPFGMCSSLANPAVASATAAALGALTPMPCVPVPAGAWLNPAPKVIIGGQPAISDGSRLMCAWGGQISAQFAGQTCVQL